MLGILPRRLAVTAECPSVFTETEFKLGYAFFFAWLMA